MWTRTLQDAGYRVLTAADAVDGARLLAGNNPAVAICEVHLPGASGLWLAELIQQQYRTTAIVLATADGALPPRETLRPAIVAYLLKPVMRGELLAAVDAAVAWAVRERSRV